MTDDELLEVSRLMTEDPHGAGLRAYGRLTMDERDRMMWLVRARADEGVKRVLAEAEADGSTDKIRELYAEDQAKKKSRRKKK